MYSSFVNLGCYTPPLPGRYEQHVRVTVKQSRREEEEERAEHV